jgi:hypothetical protein
MITRQSTRLAAAFMCGALLCAHVNAFSLQMSAGKTAVIAGATGYIGKSVVRESVRQGYKTIALVRDKSKVESEEGKLLYGQFFDGCDVVECDVTDPAKLTKVCSTTKSGLWTENSNLKFSLSLSEIHRLWKRSRPTMVILMLLFLASLLDLESKKTHMPLIIRLPKTV